MLSDKVHVERSSDTLDPEDIFADALSLFPDETRNQHGDPGATVIYKSIWFGDIRLHVIDPRNEEERKLFAHYVWNASLQLAEMISNDPRWNVEGESVLELGAGLGLAGIVALLCGAKTVTLSDYPSPTILENIRTNVTNNIPRELCDSFEVRGHIWNDFEDLFAEKSKACFTRILAADCFWMPWEHENLIHSMSHFLADADGSRIYAIAGFHTGRAKLSRFFDVLEHSELELVKSYEVDTDGNTRPWQPVRDNGKEDVTERKRWLVVAEIKRRH